MHTGRTTISTLAVATLALTACGSSGKYANRPHPPVPINLTVSINDSRVSVSPSEVGAGPVVLLVTNQASKAESLSILPAGSAAGQALASTGPINPQGTAQVVVDIKNSGDYTVTTGTGGSTDAALASPSSIQPARIHIGPPRPSAGNTLLTP